VFFGNVNDFSNAIGAKLRADGCGLFEMTNGDAQVICSVRRFVRVGHGQEIRIGMLDFRECLRRLNYPLQTIVVKLVGESASGASANTVRTETV